MSETAPEATQDGNNSGETSAADQFEAITSQEALDRIVGDRVKRERAKFSDYNELKAKAGELDKLSEASKSEQDKLIDRITGLENEIEATRLKAIRADIAREFNLTEKQAAALQYAPSEETARELAEGLAADTSTRQKTSARVPSEGRTPNSKTSTSIRDFASQMFGDNT